MASFNYHKTFTPTAPEKGSFPLDHLSVCKKFMLQYMNCMRENKDKNESCRIEAKNYLNCRMENNLMAVETFEKLGFSEEIKEQP